MSHLIYYSSTDVLVSRLDMANMAIPQAMGTRHNPVSFGDFATKTVETIERDGFQVNKEEFAVTKDGMRMFGLLQVSNGFQAPAIVGEAPKVSPWNLLVALRGSHDQKISRGLAIGSQVMVCSNLCFHGDLGNWHSKQTTNINDRLPGMIGDAVSGLRQAGQTLSVDFDSFNAATLEREQGDKLLLAIYRDKGLSPSQLCRAIGQWDSSDVKEHESNGRNLWWLFNAATHALKPTGANNNHDDLRQRSIVIYHHLKEALKSFPALLGNVADGVRRLA